jgi:5-hydroxyisourate hydrolase / 2-oxo-4-hydroxy-4-carboxy-5-ureidoimidazoline decarboxylase
MTLSDFNNLDKDIAAKELLSCCGSQNWVSLMMKKIPFGSQEALVEQATTIWYDECGKKDWLESFSQHPKIGDKKSLTEKFAGREQAGVATATKEIIKALAKANDEYEKKFGFIFIVCATGRSAEEMLRLLNDRLTNNEGSELAIALGEQHKITLIRFKKLFKDFQFLKMSQVTTHVLDISAGKPGKGISVRLMQSANSEWRSIAQGITNADGRVADLLPAGRNLAAGNYKMSFETGEYYAGQQIKTFYPAVEIQFTIFDDSHYHVPLLLSPFGYSTYRGS